MSAGLYEQMEQKFGRKWLKNKQKPEMAGTYEKSKKGQGF